MSKEITPCYGCDKRRAEHGYNCHSGCPEYKAYQQARCDRAKMICKKRAEESIVKEVRARSIQKTLKEKRKPIMWKG